MYKLNSKMVNKPILTTEILGPCRMCVRLSVYLHRHLLTKIIVSALSYEDMVNQNERKK